MPDADRPTADDPKNFANALAFALRHIGRKRTHCAAEMMAGIVSKRLVDHLERSGFVVMKKPPMVGATESYGAARQRDWDVILPRTTAALR